MACAGKDGSLEFEKIHTGSILKLLPPNAFIGDVDPQSIRKEDVAVIEEKKGSVEPADPNQLPHLGSLLNVFDFESLASKTMKKEGWDYYSSGADDEVTLRENHSAFQRIWLKPRVLINVSSIDTSCKILGHKCPLPLYITATALGKLAHPDGELAISRAAANKGIIYMLPTLGSYSLDEMMAERKADQVQFLQLYVNANKKITHDIIKKAEKGCSALCITVDAPQLGRREKDMRNKFLANPPPTQKSTSQQPVTRSQGTARALSSFIDPSLSWKDLLGSSPSRNYL